jgi:hypothetical protein
MTEEWRPEWHAAKLQLNTMDSDLTHARCLLMKQTLLVLLTQIGSPAATLG